MPNLEGLNRLARLILMMSLAVGCLVFDVTLPAATLMLLVGLGISATPRLALDLSAVPLRILGFCWDDVGDFPPGFVVSLAGIALCMLFFTLPVWIGAKFILQVETWTTEEVETQVPHNY